MKIVLYILVWPSFFGWLFPLLMICLGAAKDLRFIGNGVLAATWRPWAAKLWKYSTTLSRGMVLQADVDERILKHEFVHVRQVEDRLVLALSLALVVSVTTWDWWWMLLWPTGVAWQLPNFLTAVLRDGHVYRDAEHERSAYAQTDQRLRHNGVSWLDDHLSRKRKF